MKNFIKWIIVLTSLVFLSKVLLANFEEISNSGLDVNLMILFALSSLYALLIFLLGLSWKKILEILMNKVLSETLIYVYVKSFIAKYIPGNVFHYFVRHSEALKYGISNKVLVKSNILEAFLIVLASLLVSIPSVMSSSDNRSEILEQYFEYWVVLFLLYIIIFIFYFFYKSEIFNLRKYLYVVLQYMIFFVVAGVICWILIEDIYGINVSVIFCIGLYALSWLFGFIVPGAPGGMGVRESVFVILSIGILSQAQALLVALVLRLVNTFGEFISYVFSIYLLKKYT
jgi:uncharacterized membrane protein YbhN (UPF0104 family)